MEDIESITPVGDSMRRKVCEKARQEHAKRIREQGLTYEDAMREKPMKFLYTGLIPLSGFTFLYGEGGTFKSTFTRWIAAKTSCGELAGEFSNTPKNVVLVSTNEDTSKQVYTQYEHMGGDIGRLRVFTVAEGGDALERAETYMRNSGEYGLLIIDPASAFVEDINDSKKVEEFVTRLNNLANYCHCAIIGIGHMNKATGNPAKAWTGSQKWSDTARSVICIARNPEDAADSPNPVGKLIKCNGSQTGVKFAINVGFYAPEGEEWRNDPSKYKGTTEAPLLTEYKERQEVPIVNSISPTSVDLESFDRSERYTDIDRSEAADRQDMIYEWLLTQPNCESSIIELRKKFVGESDKQLSESQLKRALQHNKKLGYRREKRSGAGTIWHVKPDYRLESTALSELSAPSQYSQRFPLSAPTALSAPSKNHSAHSAHSMLQVGDVENIDSAHSTRLEQYATEPSQEDIRKVLDSLPLYANSFDFANTSLKDLKIIINYSEKQLFITKAQEEIEKRKQEN